MTCAECSKDKAVTLQDGNKACTYCEAYRMECEARWILRNYPAHRRSKTKPVLIKEWLERLEAVRGKSHVQQLRQVMRQQWKASQSLQSQK